MSGQWLSKRTGASGAPRRLFCFGHAGGGTGFFAHLRSRLLPEIETCPVQLPGRAPRLAEQPYTRVADLVPDAVAGLTPYLDRPYAILGHSVGAVMAYEVARALSAEGSGGPECLFVSGRRAPLLPTRRPVLHHLPDEEFLAAVAEFNGIPEDMTRHRELLDLFLPGVRADFELNETYAELPGPALSCPVVATTGREDPEVTEDEVAAWREVTRAECTVRVFAGDHFYLGGDRPEFLDLVRTHLRGLLPTQA